MYAYGSARSDEVEEDEHGSPRMPMNLNLN